MAMIIYFYIKNISLSEYVILPDIKYLQCFPASINILYLSILRTFLCINRWYKVIKLCLGMGIFS